MIYIVDSSDRDRIPDSKETFGKMHFLTIFCIIKLNNAIASRITVEIFLIFQCIS